MKTIILTEKQIKRVISQVVKEQQTPQPTPKPTNTSRETQFFKDSDGRTIKFPGITDQVKLEKFLELPRNSSEFGKMMNVNDYWIKDAKAIAARNVQMQGTTQQREMSSLNYILSGTKSALDFIAVNGILPERLIEKNVQDAIIKNNPNLGYGFNIAPSNSNAGSYEQRGPVTKEEYFEFLKNLVQTKMNELK